MGRLADLVRVNPDNWRAGLLSLVLHATFYLGIFVYLPSLYFSLRDGLLSVAIIDTFAMIAIAGLLIVKPIPFKWRASLFCFTIYLVSIGLLLGVGPISQIYLFAFSVMTALLLGLRAGLFSALLSSDIARHLFS